MEIIPQLDLNKKEDREILLEELIREEVLKIQAKMTTATPAQRVQLREDLGMIVGKYGEMAERMIGDKSSQQDAQEFLIPLFGGLFGNQQFKLKSTVKEKVNTGQFKPVDPKIEPLAIIPLSFPDNKKKEASFNHMINDFQQEEILDDSNQYMFEKKNGGIEKKDAIKQINIDIPENKDRNELIFSVKRFHQDLYGNRSKITTDVNFDNYNSNGKIYEPTAFVLHAGSLSGGHYTAYIKEKDNKWYCYNDSGRSEVHGKTLEDAKKQAYVVKYSAQGTELPGDQNGTLNFSGGYGNRCWLNASLAFANSFTTVSNDNFRSSPEQRQKLREDILGKKEEKKEPKSKEIIKNKDLEKPTNVPTNLIDPEQRLIDKIIAEPTLRNSFLNHLEKGSNFLNGIDNPGNIFNQVYAEYQECLAKIDPAIQDFDLNNDLTREFTKQYLGFLFDEYDKFGADLSDVNSIINTLKLTDKPQLAKSFKEIESSIQERSFDLLKGQVGNLKNIDNKNLNSLKNNLRDFLALVNDRNLEKDTKTLKQEVEKLQKEVASFEKRNEINKEQKINENKKTDDKKPVQSPKPEQKPISSNPFADFGVNKFKIIAPADSPNLLGDVATDHTSTKPYKDIEGKSPRVIYKGKEVNPTDELDAVRRKANLLYAGDKKKIGKIEKAINDKIANISLRDPNFKFNDAVQDSVAWLHAMDEGLDRAIKSKYIGDNLRRELKEAKTANNKPDFLRLNTLLKNRRMQIPESSDIGISGVGTPEEREWLEKNTIHRMITEPTPDREKRLIERMIKLHDDENAYYEGSLNNLIENNLAFEEKEFKLNKAAIIASESTHLIGDAANWLGQGIFAPKTRPEETTTWKKHVDHRNHLLENFYRNLNPDRDGAFSIKHRELGHKLARLLEEFANSPDKLITAEQFQEIMKLISQYAQDQEKHKINNLDDLEKKLTSANQVILAKAEEIALKEDEIWKYKMLQMLIAFSPLAPLNILNHIGDIIAPIKDFLDMCGIDTVMNWFLHESPLKYIAEPFIETFDFASNLVSPITSSTGSLLESPLAGIAIDVLATLVLADKWTELNTLKRKAKEESEGLNRNYIKSSNEAVEKYENDKIIECTKQILPIWENNYKKLAVYDKLCEKDYSELKTLAGDKLDEFMKSDEFKNADINDDGSSKDSLRKKLLASLIARDLTDKAIGAVYNGDSEQAKKDGYFKMARDHKIPYYNLPQILNDKIRNNELREEDYDYWLVKTHCAKNGINFNAIYRSNSTITDIVTSDLTNPSKRVPNLSPDEKKAIAEEAEKLRELYSKQESNDVEKIKKYVLKTIENGFDRSGASRDEFESVVPLTDDHGIKRPSPIMQPYSGNPLNHKNQKQLIGAGAA